MNGTDSNDPNVDYTTPRSRPRTDPMTDMEVDEVETNETMKSLQTKRVSRAKFHISNKETKTCYKLSFSTKVSTQGFRDDQ